MPTRTRKNPDQGRVFDTSYIAPCLVNMSRGDTDNRSFWKKIIVLGQMDNKQDHTLESSNRVYSTDGICPTIQTMQGGDRQPKVLVNE